MILCSIKNLNLGFGQKIIYKNAELTINKKDKIGILGLNGKGKSSLFKILNESVKADISTPPFLFDKSKYFSAFLVPQEVDKSLINMLNIQEFFFEFYPEIKKIWFDLQNINELIDQGDVSDKNLVKQREMMEELEHLNCWEVLRSYESYASYFGLKDLEKPLKQLSGGELKKLLLSLGLSSSAEIILWDEPTNHLDIETIELFQGELEQTDKTFLLISHDRYLISEVTNRIFHIEHGSVSPFEGSYTQYLEHLAFTENEREKLLEKLKNRHRRETEWMRQGIKARGTRSKKRVENFNDLSSQIGQLKEKAKKSLSLEVSDSGRKTKEITRFENAAFSYDDKNIFKNISFELYKGDKVGIIGENGVGKSTLINLIIGQLKISSGKYKLADDLIIKLFSQNREELEESITPFELLGEGNDFIQMPSGHSLHVATWFQKFLFDKDQLHRPLSTFSGGERNRLQLAMNLKDPGDVWIFDEPTNDLDLETIQVLENALNEFKGTLIIISHDRAFLGNITNRVFIIEDQEIEVFEGGFSQAESYLEFRTIEKNLKSQISSSATETEQATSKPSKDSKEKPLLKTNTSELEKLIIEKESLIEKIDALLSDLGSIQVEKETIEKMTKLGEKKAQIEEDLLELYTKREEA